MCHANGINPSQRILQLIAWDLQQGGVDLGEIEARKKQDKMSEITEQAQMMEMVKNIIAANAQEIIAMQQQRLQELKQIYDEERQRLLMELKRLREQHGQAQGGGNLQQNQR